MGNSPSNTNLNMIDKLGNQSWRQIIDLPTVSIYNYNEITYIVLVYSSPTELTYPLGENFHLTTTC